MYEAADQSWRERPRAVSDHVISHTARRLAEHAEKHRLSSVSVIPHGGEPLLAGPERLRRVREARTAGPPPDQGGGRARHRLDGRETALTDDREGR